MNTLIQFCVLDVTVLYVYEAVNYVYLTDVILSFIPKICKSNE